MRRIKILRLRKLTNNSGLSIIGDMRAASTRLGLESIGSLIRPCRELLQEVSACAPFAKL